MRIASVGDMSKVKVNDNVEAGTIWDGHEGLSCRAKVLLAMAPMNQRKLDVEFPIKEVSPKNIPITKREFWCNSHQRLSTLQGCDRKQGMLAISCDIVELTGIACIEQTPALF